MTSISITLIRKTHDDFSIDNVESLSVIRLDNQGINCIDNLEVFSHIRELYLSNNEIEMIENIDFLDNLEFLDLSNNRITSQNLITSIALLPQNLKTLNLANNPCSSDESALLILQDKCPSLNIVVGVYTGGEIIENIDNLELNKSNLSCEEDSSLIESNDDNEGDDDDHPLNADEVLKALVERKCRLQSIETFNSKETVEALNIEYDKALEIDADKNIIRKMKSQLKNQSPSKLSFQDRLNELKETEKENKLNDFKTRLKLSAKNALEAINIKNDVS